MAKKAKKAAKKSGAKKPPQKAAKKKMSTKKSAKKPSKQLSGAKKTSRTPVKRSKRSAPVSEPKGFVSRAVEAIKEVAAPLMPNSDSAKPTEH